MNVFLAERSVSCSSGSVSAAKPISTARKLAERFYNPERRHIYANDVSPVEFENHYFNRYRVSRKAGAIQSRLAVSKKSTVLPSLSNAR